MKKTLSIFVAGLLTVCLALSSFAAANKSTVQSQLDATVGYMTDGISAYTADTAIDFYYLVNASDVAASYYPDFIQNVKDNLAANDGKIVTVYGESMTTYAAVVGIISAMGEDPTDVNSVDITELLANADASTVSNPYHYNVIIPVMAEYCDEAVTKAVCDGFIANYYTLGSGMDYWGFAADNTAMFLSAVVQSGLTCYDEIIEDAVAVLKTYKTEGGYCYNPMYGTEANVNSTGLALMALCRYYEALGTASENIDELNSLYEELLTFAGETEGSFAYDGVESTYSAADALRGISAYRDILPNGVQNAPDDDENADNPTENAPSNDGNTNYPADPATEKPSQGENNEPEIPNTGSNGIISVSAALAISSIAIAYSLKKKKN